MWSASVKTWAVFDPMLTKFDQGWTGFDHRTGFDQFWATFEPTRGITRRSGERGLTSAIQYQMPRMPIRTSGPSNQTLDMPRNLQGPADQRMFVLKYRGRRANQRISDLSCYEEDVYVDLYAGVDVDAQVEVYVR